MSIEEDLKKDMEYWDRNIACAFGGYKGGYNTIDDPYYGMTAEEKERMLAAARNRDREDYQAELDRQKASAAAEARREARYGEMVDRRVEAAEHRASMAAMEERRELSRQKNEAMERLRNRYNDLGFFKKLFAKKPRNLDTTNMTIEQMDQIYQGGRIR